jgi:outer membrane protein
MDVARAYFDLDGLDAQLASARVTLANARLLEAATAARKGYGEGTVTELVIAQRGVAQAALTIPQAEAARDTACLALLALLDLPPQTPLRVASSADRPLGRDTPRTLDAMMADALRQRPDMLAELARLRAAEQGIAAARSAMLPRISTAVNVQGNIGQLRTDGGPYQGIAQPQAGVFLRFDRTLFQGGALANTR